MWLSRITLQPAICLRYLPNKRLSMPSRLRIGSRTIPRSAWFTFSSWIAKEFDLSLRECLDVLRERHPNARFVILDEEQTLEQTVGLLALGVHGFVSYTQIDKLSQSVDRISQGELCFSSSVLEAYARRSIASLNNVNRSPTGQAITPRESQILELVKRRLSNKEIGAVLNIQESTVKFHLSNVFSKLRVNRRRELQAKDELSDIWKQLLAS